MLERIVAVPAAAWELAHDRGVEHGSSLADALDAGGELVEVGFYHRLAPWYEAQYGLFTNQPGDIERALAGIKDRL